MRLRSTPRFHQPFGDLLPRLQINCATAIIGIRRHPANLEDPSRRRGAHNRLRRLAITTVKQIVGRRKPERRWLFVIHHNGRDHPERLLVVMTRSFVKSHPLASWRKQRQRSASFGATGTGTFSTSRHDSKLI
jgi:hypothetical protein